MAKTKPELDGRTRAQIIAALPPEDRAAVEARSAEFHAEVEGLKALRQLAQRSQEQIAQGLGIKQPAVLKIERQTDLHLSTLRRFVEAAGGTLELRVELPGAGVLRLTGMGELRAGRGSGRMDWQAIDSPSSALQFAKALVCRANGAPALR